MKEFIFHGGPLKSEFFNGHSFWTTNYKQAADYADNGDIYVVDVDWSKEAIDYETNHLADMAYENCDDGYDNWFIQTEAIKEAVSAGATAVICDDGIAMVNIERLNPRRVTLAEAREIWEDAQ